MSITKLVKKWKQQIKTNGINGLTFIGYDIAGAFSYFSGIHSRGDHIFNYDWDVLIILDACRYDMYKEEICMTDKFISMASTSSEWIEKNFNEKFDDEVKNTAYITANPHSNELDEERFGLLDQVWKYEWNKELGTVTPETITDRTIQVGREYDFNRIIAHYMQPHFPFIGGEYNVGKMVQDNHGENIDNEGNIWHQIILGNLSLDEIEEPYRANLRYAMESIKVLQENIDGKLILTADHGNALGEWGVWGHPKYLPLNSLREVPWDCRSATDTNSYTPSVDQENLDDSNVRDRLKSLGYM